MPNLVLLQELEQQFQLKRPLPILLLNLDHDGRQRYVA